MTQSNHVLLSRQSKPLSTHNSSNFGNTLSGVQIGRLSQTPFFGGQQSSQLT